MTSLLGRYNCGADNWVISLKALKEHGLLASQSSGVVTLFDWNLSEKSSITAHSTPIKSMTVVDDNTFATCASDSVKVWDVRSGNAVATFNNDRNTPFLSLDCAHGMLAAGTELQGVDSELLLWDLRTMSKIRSFVDSHHDDITDIKFHPSDKSLLMSGSTDGYINIYDLNQDEEDDALHQVINMASVHSCGWLSPTRIYGLTHMETFSIYELNDKSDELQEPKPLEFGDVREVWNCEYVVDVYPGYVAVGKNSENELKFLPFADEKVDVNGAVYAPGAHGDDVVRSCYLHDNGIMYTGGEDGLVSTGKLRWLRRSWCLTRTMC